MTVAEAFVALLFLYAGAGLAFAVPFLARGIERIDSQARGSGLGFRLIILPGVVAFWPLLLRRWIAGHPEPPEERNAHRIGRSRNPRSLLDSRGSVQSRPPARNRDREGAAFAQPESSRAAKNLRKQILKGARP